MPTEPFSVWHFNVERVEGAAIVSWREEFEDGTNDVRIAVHTAHEFVKAVDRFSQRAKLTWEFYAPSAT